jgi:hypothetical protein
MVSAVQKLVTMNRRLRCYICCWLHAVIDQLTLRIILLITNGGSVIHMTIVLSGQNITYCVDTISMHSYQVLLGCCIIRCAFITSVSNFCSSVLILRLLLTLTSSSIASARCSFNIGNGKSWWTQPDDWVVVNELLGCVLLVATGIHGSKLKIGKD